MKLQLALDLVDLNEAQALLAELHDLVDLVEIGTPFLIREGVKAITDIKRTYPALEVLADVKIMDAGDYEAKLAYDAGADIVTGVQSHVPQAVEFGEGGLILYGLGNLFFDQMWSLPTRQGLIARHTVYDGRHLSTQLLTTILEDFAQPRWTTDSERELLLRPVFTASGW